MYLNRRISIRNSIVNFKLRSMRSDAPMQRFVEDLSQQFKVPFFSVEFDTHQYRKKINYHWKNSPSFAISMAKKTSEKEFQYTAIATAHHLNDSAETLLFASGARNGLRDSQVFRQKSKYHTPLAVCHTGRDQEFIAANAINYRTDLSNNEDQFDRNKIRNNIIPMLRD